MSVLLDSNGVPAVFNEESVAVVTVAPYGLDGSTAITPNTATWSLLKPDETIVNSRQQVVIATPSTSMSIVLSANDLEILDGDEFEERYLLTEWTFDDATYGNNLPGKDQVSFTVANLRKVT